MPTNIMRGPVFHTPLGLLLLNQFREHAMVSLQPWYDHYIFVTQAQGLNESFDHRAQMAADLDELHKVAAAQSDENAKLPLSRLVSSPRSAPALELLGTPRTDGAAQGATKWT